MTTPLPRPWLTYGLIAANLAVFVWSTAMGVGLTGGGNGRLLVDLGANFGTLTLGGEPWRLATSMFLHAGLLHVTMNLFGLHDSGRQIETLYGKSGMGAIYTVAGLLGALASAMRNVGPSVGASGAVFGLLVAFAMVFPNRIVTPLFPPIPMRAPVFVVVYGVLELVLGVSGTQQGVAHFAHLGGLAGGYLYLQLSGRRR